MSVSLGHTSRLERNHTEAPLFSHTSATSYQPCAKQGVIEVKKADEIVCGFMYPVFASTDAFIDLSNKEIMNKKEGL